METIYKSAGIIIKNRKLLVVRTKGKDVFFSPGGKRDAHETDISAVIRELKEELDISVHEAQVEEFGTWNVPATGAPERTLCMHVFMIKNYDGTPAPTNEIEEIRWVNSITAHDSQIGSVFRDYVIPKLKEMDLID